MKPMFTEDPSVKWKRMSRNRCGCPLAINIVDANSIGLTQIVPTHFESPLDALMLILPNDILLLVIRYTTVISATFLSANSTVINLAPRRRF